MPTTTWLLTLVWNSLAVLMPSKTKEKYDGAKARVGMLGGVLGFLVSWFLGFLVSTCLGFLVSWLQKLAKLPFHVFKKILISYPRFPRIP